MCVKSVPFATALALSAVLVMSGCKSSAPASDATTAQQPASQPATQPAAEPATAPATAPAASPAPAPAATPAAAPAPAPAPAPVAQAAPAPMPAAEPPAPAPPPPPKKLTVPSGTAIPVTITQQLSAKTANVGDSFSGELAGSVKTSGGATVFPRGAHVLGTVVGAKGRGRFKGAGDLAIQITSISGTPVSVGIYEKEQKGKGKRTAGFIGGGARRRRFDRRHCGRRQGCSDRRPDWRGCGHGGSGVHREIRML